MIDFDWDQQLIYVPIPTPSIFPTIVYLGLSPLVRAQQSSVSAPQLVSYQAFLETVFHRAYDVVPLVVVATQHAAKLGLKVDSLKLITTQSRPAFQCSRQVHFISQQFQAQSEFQIPTVAADLPAVYQKLWFLVRLAEPSAKSMIASIRTLLIYDMLIVQITQSTQIYPQIQQQLNYHSKYVSGYTDKNIPKDYPYTQYS